MSEIEQTWPTVPHILFKAWDQEGERLTIAGIAENRVKRKAEYGLVFRKQIKSLLAHENLRSIILVHVDRQVIGIGKLLSLRWVEDFVWLKEDNFTIRLEGKIVLVDDWRVRLRGVVWYETEVQQPLSLVCFRRRGFLHVVRS